MADAQIKWDGETHPEYEPKVREEIAHLFDNGLACAADLIFHHIDLGADFHGPCIMLWGKENDPCFYAEYVHKPVIVDGNGQTVSS
jgi:hypothetical protein